VVKGGRGDPPRAEDAAARSVIFPEALPFRADHPFPGCCRFVLTQFIKSINQTENEMLFEHRVFNAEARLAVRLRVDGHTFVKDAFAISRTSNTRLR